MKKLILFTLIALLAVSVFALCKNRWGQPEPPTTTNGSSESIVTTSQASTSSTQTTTAKTTAPTTATTSNCTSATTTLPVYVPGSIKLMPLFELDVSSGWDVRYRSVYYGLIGDYDLMVGQENFDKWFDYYCKELDGKEPQEMMLVTFIKHFNISREVFEAENQGLIKAWTNLGVLNKDERYEAPNADIVYTFDNDIINEYYRRA